VAISLSFRDCFVASRHAPLAASASPRDDINIISLEKGLLSIDINLGLTLYNNSEISLLN
jgi:hypothetical protein